jgi:tetratricopeptide (TPR) repeat protein
MPSRRRLNNFIDFINVLTHEKEFNLAFNLGYGLAERFPKVSDAQLVFTQICLNRRILFLADKYAFLAYGLRKDDYRILNCCGIVLMYKNDLNGAKDFFLKAIENRPDLPQSYMNLSQAYLFSNDFDNCERSLEKAISLDSHYMPAYIALAQFVLMVKNDRRRFDKLLQEIRKIDPNEKAISMLLYQSSQSEKGRDHGLLDEWLQKCKDESDFPF